MKKTNKLKSPIHSYMRYMYWPLILTLFIIAINVPLYYYDRKSGICVSIFAVLYFLVMLTVFMLTKTSMRNAVINFATQYGTVQKKLLSEFEIPYALLDYNSKILWMNEAFCAVTEKDKNYHKSITTIFPAITRELLVKDDDVSDIHVNPVFRRSTRKIP